MNLELKGVENVGDIERERVILRALADKTDIGDYAIFKCRTTSDGVPASGHVAAAYWFPDRVIKSGDFVVLYTKRGAASEKTGETGHTSYFFYWGHETPQWSSKFIAALVHTSDWDFTGPLK
jgi:hypothetical protein